MPTIAQLRILVQDPAGATQVLDDTDYDAIILLENNVYRAAAIAARTIAASYAKKTAVKAGPVAVEAQQKFEHYQDLADSYDQRAREGGGSDGTGTLSENAGAILTGISISEIEAVDEDVDRYDGVFKRGMDDNPTGSEDFKESVS